MCRFEAGALASGINDSCDLVDLEQELGAFGGEGACFSQIDMSAAGRPVMTMHMHHRIGSAAACASTQAAEVDAGAGDDVRTHSAGGAGANAGTTAESWQDGASPPASPPVARKAVSGAGMIACREQLAAHALVLPCPAP